MTDAKHEGLPVAGYKPQNGEAVELVNRNKLTEEFVLRILDEMATIAAVDKCWLAVGRTQIEQGFMAVNRSIFKPGRVVLPDDASLEEQMDSIRKHLGLPKSERAQG